MSDLRRVEVAAMWFYHDEYAKQRLGAKEFYRQLPPYRKGLMKDMVREIVEAQHGDHEHITKCRKVESSTSDGTGYVMPQPSNAQPSHADPPQGEGGVMDIKVRAARFWKAINGLAPDFPVSLLIEKREIAAIEKQLSIELEAHTPTAGEVMVDEVMTVDEIWQGRDTMTIIIKGINDLNGTDRVRIRVTRDGR